MANPCPVTDCGRRPLAGTPFCPDDWQRLPDWARDDLGRLLTREPDSDLTRRTVDVAVAYLSETATVGAA